MASPRPVKQRAPAGPFLTDPSFCPHCGSILPLPGASDVVACRLCNFKLDTAVFEDVEEYSCKWFAERKGKRDLSSEGDGPTVERQCPNCGHTEMTYSTLQTRSADEGQTVFYTCNKCKFKETENS